MERRMAIEEGTMIINGRRNWRFTCLLALKGQGNSMNMWLFPAH
jgi:hypothetical protein